MSDVSFNEEQTITRYAPAASKKSGISGLLMRLGVAGNESQANKVMIGIIVFAVVVMIIIWMPHGSKPSAQIPPTNPVPGAAPAP